jgi:uncharacterized protein YutE (UPF0331/DUF86 family)
MDVFDRKLVTERLDLIAECLRYLRELAREPEETFIGSLQAAAAESYLRRALESAFDVGRHILARQGRRYLAAEYHSIARGLVELGVVPRTLGDALQRMAAYRHRLAHLYHPVSDEELLRIMRHELDALEEFSAHVSQYVAARSQAS